MSKESVTSSPHSVSIISAHYWKYFLISCFFLIPGIISLSIWQLKAGIDFSGGLIIDFTAQAGKSMDDITKVLPGDVSVIRFDSTEKGNYTLRLTAQDDSKRTQISQALTTGIAGYKETGYTSIGPAIGQELIIKTGAAIGIASLLIAIYLALRFRSIEYGVCAVLATLHDVVILLGVFSLLGHFVGVEVDTLFVTALLTVISFSVHDTVVVYDRIRERKKKILREHLYETIDSAVLETLTRSIRNSLAVIIVLLALILLGGETLRWFGMALLVGTIAGTYSSTFVALPLLIASHKIKEKWFLEK